MKRISTWLILVLLVFSLAGCAGTNNNSSSNPPENSNTQIPDTVSDTEVPPDTTDTPSDNSSASADIGVFDTARSQVTEWLRKDGFIE